MAEHCQPKRNPLLFVRKIWQLMTAKLQRQEAQLMLTTGSTRLAVSRGQQYGNILGPLRLFAKHVIGTAHKETHQ